MALKVDTNNTITPGRFGVVVKDNGFLDFTSRQLRQISRTLREDPVLQKSLWGPRLAKRLGVWAGSVVARNMAKREDAQGRAWAPLTPATIKNKTRLKKKGLIPGNPATPLVATGALLKTFATARSRSGGPPARITGTNAPVIEFSRTHGGAVVRPRGKASSARYKTLFAVHNQPTDHYTPNKGAFRNASPIPGREFFYFTREDTLFLSQVATYALLAGRSTKKGRPVSNGKTRTRAGDTVAFANVAPTLKGLIDANSLANLRSQGVVQFVDSI